MTFAGRRSLIEEHERKYGADFKPAPARAQRLLFRGAVRARRASSISTSISRIAPRTRRCSSRRSIGISVQRHGAWAGFHVRYWAATNCCARFAPRRSLSPWRRSTAAGCWRAVVPKRRRRSTASTTGWISTKFPPRRASSLLARPVRSAERRPLVEFKGFDASDRRLRAAAQPRLGFHLRDHRRRAAARSAAGADRRSEDLDTDRDASRRAAAAEVFEKLRELRHLRARFRH